MTTTADWHTLPPSKRPLDYIVGSPRRRARPSQNGGAIELEVAPIPQSGAPPQTIVVSVDQFIQVLRWLDGRGAIQDMLPDMTPEWREIVQTGLVLPPPPPEEE